LDDKNKIAVDFLRSALKRKNKVEEGRTLGSRVKREHESIELRA
jgi:hypothetical protein